MRTKMANIASKPCSDHAFHVDRNRTLGSWDVVDHEGRAVGHCQDRAAAIALAVREAQYVHGRGTDVAVCVEQDDGYYSLAWSSS